MEELPFKPITPNAEWILNKILKNMNLSQALNKKFICACLGPNKENELYKFRVCCLNHLNKRGNFSFFPEQIKKGEVSTILGKNNNLDKIQEKALLDDKNVLNEVLVCQSDLVFIICSGVGPFVEIGKYSKSIPHKIWLLIPEDKYSEDSQIGLEIKTIMEHNSGCLITFKDEEDICEKIDKLLSIELRKQLRREMNG